MGIHGIFKEIGPGQRISLAKFSSDHYVSHERPLRLAIDVSIWLFQIQAGKGGSNPALRTFYYRLLRLLTHNIHPLFVFDGPNKPLFKRNKKVGGPGLRTASVPEFLAKQLLKQFGFPWHVAPGEAEAECALLQREAIVDAVLSEDVDTLMFGSGVTVRNWSPENTSKTPTHVNVYRAVDTMQKSGMDREGMILVALMSGGDYITEGIPGCGPKVACDAARAGYGRELCAIRKTDAAAFSGWREKLQHQIRTNEHKIFSRKNTKLTIPDDFPNLEVLGYYTQPCVSTAEKLTRLRETFKWDQQIDFPALRSFAADAFDWRCLGGAKKFIRNLAPAMLVREIRLFSDQNLQLSQQAQEEREKQYVAAIHGKRNHQTTDGELEYRISFIPLSLIPIDLSVEDDDDDFIQAGGGEDKSDTESELAVLPSSAADGDGSASPTRKRVSKPYEPDQPEKLWILRSFLRVGCPTLVEDYEASLRVPNEFCKQRRKARVAASASNTTHAKKLTKKDKAVESQAGTMLQYGTITKPSQELGSEPPGSQRTCESPRDIAIPKDFTGEAQLVSLKIQNDTTLKASGFKLPSTQLPSSLQKEVDAAAEDDEEETPRANRQVSVPSAATRTFAPFMAMKARKPDRQRTPRGQKRLSDEAVSPTMSQRTIDSYWSPSPRRPTQHASDVVNLVSSSPAKFNPHRALTPASPAPQIRPMRESNPMGENDLDFLSSELPQSVTKRQRKAPLRRSKTAPVKGVDKIEVAPLSPRVRPSTPEVANIDKVEAMDLASPSHIHSALSSSSTFVEAQATIVYFEACPTSVSTKMAGDAVQVKPAAPLTASETVSTKSKVSSPPSTLLPLRRSPRQQHMKRKRIQLRESLAGAWKETEVEEIDLTGDGSGWRQSQGRAKPPSWRKSGVEVLDLTDA